MLLHRLLMLQVQLRLDVFYSKRLTGLLFLELKLFLREELLPFVPYMVDVVLHFICDHDLNFSGLL